MQPEYTKILKEVPPPVYQLTVITVCWNALADLKPTVESVLRQKAKGTISIEHVVVDGASTDGTPEWLAEQLAAGNIERYVSEPDRGIYDAMNKGINLARGEVLAFLNAGDWYTDEDLAPCVLPVCNGETQTVAACAHWLNSKLSPEFKPSYEQLFFYCPCCHQSFFASAQAYRELGGYDARALRCSADADIMYRMFRKWGMPLILERFVVNFPAGGMSTNSADLFRDENVELLWRNRDLIKKRCAEEEDYKLAMEAYLLYHCQQFHDWQERHGRHVPQTLEKLREMCEEMSATAHSRYARTAFRFMAHAYLPSRIKGLPCSKAMQKMLKFWLHACYMPEGNKYRRLVWVPNTPLSSNPWFFFLR